MEEGGEGMPRLLWVMVHNRRIYSDGLRGLSSLKRKVLKKRDQVFSTPTPPTSTSQSMSFLRSGNSAAPSGVNVDKIEMAITECVHALSYLPRFFNSLQT